MLDPLSLAGIGIIGSLVGLFVYYNYKDSNKPKIRQRYTFEDDVFECDDGDKEKEPAKPKRKVLTEEEKEAIKDKRSHASMLKRAQKKFTDYAEDNVTLLMTTVLYGTDEDGHPDLKAFAEFSGGVIAIYHGCEDETKDGFLVFPKTHEKDLKNIFDSHYMRPS